MAQDNNIDKELLGVDLVATPNWDLAVNVHDLATQTGLSNVINAFIRELTTPQGFIGRYVYDIEGLKLIDGDYGNPAYYQLSEPLTNLWINDMMSHVQTVAVYHPRLTLDTIDYQLLDVERNQVQFMINFRVETSADSVTLLLVRNGTVLTAGVLEG